MVYNDPFLVQK